VRLIKLEDVKRSIEKRTVNQAPVVTAIRIEGLAGFHSISVTPQSGFMSICGGNRSRQNCIARYNLRRTCICGNDPHDRFHTLAVALGLDENALIPLAFRHWLSRPGRKRRLKRLARELAEKLNIQLPNS
jgi:hypothetical protein